VWTVDVKSAHRIMPKSSNEQHSVVMILDTYKREQVWWLRGFPVIWDMTHKLGGLCGFTFNSGRDVCFGVDLSRKSPTIT
jgi:hypothetical protein